MTEKITRDELKTKLDRGDDVTLVEALPARYYRHQHLPGALNIPHDEVRELAADMLPERSAEIVVYCASGPCRNSAIAAEELTRLGYTNVRDYHEGKADWVEAGYPTESGESTQATGR
ncbi:rhodanese-like domain-containing protein [Arhodomonas sp. AD133]|uniref:rhodanese-like domain-containing protein n=1 Tax=Arhodomonas sp. AD133 TaxID=3415009 RepID=UPI003EBF9758